MAQSDSEKSNALLREMYRSSQDLIRIYNPTDKDFYIIWDNFKHLVPNKNKNIGYGNGQLVTQRYLANWYFKHMKDQLINEENDKKLKDYQEELEKKGVENALFKANQQFQFNKKTWTTDPERVAQLAEVLILGLEKKYGMDDVIEETGMEDMRPIEEQVLERMNRPVKQEKPQEGAKFEHSEPTKYPINRAKKQLIEEVTQ